MSILVATDLSDHSRHAVRWASALAASRGRPLYVAHVIDSLGDDELWSALFETPDQIEQRVLQNASDNVTNFVSETLSDGTPTPNDRHVLVAVGPPADELARFAKQKGAELIVSGTTGHGVIRNAIFGSTAHRLTHETATPTVFVPQTESVPPTKKLLVAVDFSECSNAALQWAGRWAGESDAEVTVVHGIGVSALSPDYEPAANFVPMINALTEQRDEQIRKKMKDYGIDGDVVISRAAPAEAILDTAEEIGADMIVMGTHGRGAVGRLFLGSVAIRVLRNPPCPVATIHPPQED
jgi:nucleotide-binding universal stress UspA family protein